MSTTSVYKICSEVTAKPRKVDYQKIYDMIDRGERPKIIQAELNIGYGTIRHAIRMRMKSGWTPPKKFQFKSRMFQGCLIPETQEMIDKLKQAEGKICLVTLEVRS